MSIRVHACLGIRRLIAMGRKSDPPVVLIKWYDFTKCACMDCSRPTRAKCESTSSGVEPLTGGRGIGIVGSSDRGIRGGDWNNNSNNLSSSIRNNNNPANENNNIGFRVASPFMEQRQRSSLFGPESRRLHVAASSTVPSQGLPDSPAHRRFCWWANNVMCGCGE